MRIGPPKSMCHFVRHLAAPEEADDHGNVLEVAEFVRETIQVTLDGMVAERKSVLVADLGALRRVLPLDTSRYALGVV